MIDRTRIGMYNFVYNLLYNVVSKNVYSMERPQELTTSDATDGFVVIRVGNMNDAREFIGNAYVWARVFVECYIPPKSRGRLDKNKFAEMENVIDGIIDDWIDKTSEDGYSISIESLISSDDFYASNKDNPYHVLVKSFVVYNNNN